MDDAFICASTSICKRNLTLKTSYKNYNMQTVDVEETCVCVLTQSRHKCLSSNEMMKTQFHWKRNSSELFKKPGTSLEELAAACPEELAAACPEELAEEPGISFDSDRKSGVVSSIYSQINSLSKFDEILAQ